MEEKQAKENEQQQVKESKDFIESLLDKDNIGAVLKDFFVNNAANTNHFFEALSLVVKEESNRVISSNEQDHESHLIYIKSLESHLRFLERLLDSEKNLDRNDIEKKILKIIEEMKEERNKQRDFRKDQQAEDRKELTKRMMIGAALAGAGVFAVTMVVNKGNVAKSAEDSAKVVEHFIGGSLFK